MGVWMLGFDVYDLKKVATLDVRGYDAGSEKNNEKKGYLGALGAGNMLISAAELVISRTIVHWLEFLNQVSSPP
jgi:hypothetical protein